MTDDHRLVHQRRFVALLDRRIEGVAVDVGDGELAELGMRKGARRTAARARAAAD
jgi:hypothetical protein